jgi:hypothetical protein
MTTRTEGGHTSDGQVDRAGERRCPPVKSNVVDAVATPGAVALTVIDALPCSGWVFREQGGRLLEAASTLQRDRDGALVTLEGGSRTRGSR